jgi:hypothetical protein
MYYQFLLNLWIMRALGDQAEARLQTAVTKGYIAQDEMQTILARPQV